MPFHHKKSGGHSGGQDSMWTSYSDLFLGLSVVFLLLYVTASLRQGTEGLQQHMNYQKLTKENEDLKQQLQVYSTLKQDYLEKQASPDEAQNYQELMNKLDLLQEQAKDEKNRLQAEATENDKKGKALNKYQQMIRNIINTNMLAKSRIKNRDTMIEDQGVQIGDLQSQVQQKKAQIQASNSKISNLEKNLDTKLKQLKNSWKANQITKKKYEEQQHKLKQSAENQIAQLREQTNKTKNDLAKLNSELSTTKGELNHTKGALNQAQDQNQKLQGDLAETSNKLGAMDSKYKATAAELARAQENLNARKKVAGKIIDNFRHNGIKADVDPKTGDVVLAFGDQYFDSDSANLKNGMKKILEQAVPVYSASLFEDHKIADKIANVEIVGYASPTYKGKFVDPRSLDPSDRQAVNYNLDLSYNRARSIFNHIFDQDKMTFKYQQKLLPLVKVTGRSFLDQGERGVASESQDSFCHKNDCAKLQRVIIKFNLKD